MMLGWTFTAFLVCLCASLAYVYFQPSSNALTREQSSEPVIAPFVPEFIACEQPEPCQDEFASRWLGDLVARVDQVVREANNTPTLLHIGGGGFWVDRPWTDVMLYREVLSRLSSTTGSPVRLFLVEAMPRLVKFSQRHLDLLNVPGGAHVINGFVYGHCEGMHFYGMSDQVMEDFGINVSWDATSREQLLNVIRFVADDYLGKTFVQGPPEMNERFWAFANMPNLSDYIEEVQTPCLTPLMLLEMMNATAQDLSMVVIDAEGSDNSILDAFLSLSGFQPTYLQWEDRSDATPSRAVLTKELRARGYSVGNTDPKSTDGENMLAVRSPPN